MSVIAGPDRTRAGSLAAVVALLLVAGLLGASSARAGELAFKGCLSGSSGVGACAQIPSATDRGCITGDTETAPRDRGRAHRSRAPRTAGCSPDWTTSTRSR